MVTSRSAGRGGAGSTSVRSPSANVIRSATVNAADLIDMSASIGTIEAGKYADIIAVSGSPLDDIGELLDVDFVMKGGKVYKH